MLKGLRWRILVILGTLAIGIVGMVPVQEKIRLGLDLKGGMHLVLQVQMDDALHARRDNEITTIRNQLNEEGNLHFFTFETPDFRTILIRAVEGFEPAAVSKALDSLRNYLNDNYLATWDIHVTESAIELRMKPELVTEIHKRTSEQAVETIRRRVDEFGLAEVVVVPQGAQQDRVLVQLPGVEDPQQVKDLIKETAFLEWRLVKNTAGTKDELIQVSGGVLPPGTEILEGFKERSSGESQAVYYLVPKESVITGQDLENAYQCQDKFGRPAVCFRLSRDGGRRFYTFTGQHINEALGIVLDRKVLSAPVIQAQIGSEGIIEGIGVAREAEKLSIQLRSGALPASLTVVEERQIGPALGRDSIRKGSLSAIAGLAIVMLFMLLYYKLAGVNADLALLLNVVLILAGISYFKATLTLPGIAGIALTIGMAVDANVLVFERIKEELRLGKTVRSAIDQGFSRAFATIVDSNVTTLVAAIALYIWGTGPVQGFAITLSLGIIASMFTAVFVSRTLFELYLSYKQIERLSI